METFSKSRKWPAQPGQRSSLGNVRRVFASIVVVVVLACSGVHADDVAPPPDQARGETAGAEGMDSAAALLLSGNDWRIHEDADGRGAERGMPSADASASGWIAATVPGNIQADVEAARQLKPLWYGEGDPRMAEVARKDWWYRKDVLVPRSFQGKRVTLVFDGVDHECEVWLNGRKIGGNAGMFRRFSFDVTAAVQPGRKNQLAVRVARIPEELVAVLAESDTKGGPKVGPAINATRQRLKELKSPTNCAWDWAVAVWTLGIWKDVRLEATGPARIEWVRVQTPLSDNYRRAAVKVRLEVDSSAEMQAKAVLRVRRKADKSEACPAVAVDVSLKKGRNDVQAERALENPALWWPNGQGEQPLYELESTLVAADNATAPAAVLSDRRVTRFGVREIRWEQCPGAPADFINPLKLVVNGRPVRQMGSNLLPPDCLFGRMDQRGPRLLELARAAHINCLRVWGGGVVLSEKMYERADELGIMLLEEFPLANNVPETDEVMLANFEATISNIIKQTRNHPCIVEWTGGNEMPWRNGTRHPALQLLEKLVREEDGRMFRATEPAQGSGAHGTYTYVYHTVPAPYLTWLGAGGLTLYQRYNTASQMRISEFGTNSPANLDVWHREVPPSSQWPLKNHEDPVLIRKNAFWGAVLPQNWLHKEIVDSLFGPAEDLERLVEGGQFLAAEGLRYAMDALRRNGPALGGGFMSWNYNEPWPNAAGSYMIDYDGRPLMNYDFVRQALAPVALSLKYDSLLFDARDGVKAELFLTSDSPRAAENVKWRWLARDRRGQVFARGDGTSSIEPIEVKALGAIELKPPAKTARGPIFLELRLEDARGSLLAERLHVFGLSGVTAPLAGLLKHQDDDPDDDGPQGKWAEDNRPAIHRPVRRTTLAVAAKPIRAEGRREVLELSVKNTGSMTALFCEPHPLIEYRTDLFIDNNHCFIPPGECRALSIRAEHSARSGITLAQTGWRISCWNTDDVVIEPNEEVLLAVGRRDQMCREYMGYFDVQRAKDATRATLEGTRPNAAKLPYLLTNANLARFEFEVSAAQAVQPARLRIHTADQSKDVAALVELILNGTSVEQSLPKGLGIQNTDPAHLAFPATLSFQVVKGALRPGRNTVEIRVKNGSWLSWDAIDLISLVNP